ncbi:MAG: glycosyltransferase [Calothrix sp. MO_167.B12]|nr:glycosyltransferase [Calothrix sp. MO_167.B12]
MKLLIVGRFKGMGGSERSLISLIQELKDYEITLMLLKPPKNNVFFHNYAGKLIISNLSINWDKIQFIHQIKTVLQLNNEISKADIIISVSELTPTYISWFLSRWHRKKLLAHVQCNLNQWIQDSNHWFHHLLSRWIYPQIYHIRCASQGVAEVITQYYKVPAENLSVIYPAFELDKIIQAGKLPIEERYHHIFEKPTIVTVGRLTHQKRFDIAIEAIFHLRKSYGIDANLLILGEGKLRPQLEQQVQDLELTKHIFMPGFVENPYPYITKSQILLLSSDHEGFGRVVVEALALGCPVISTDCPSGPSTILEKGKYGLLTPPGQAREITDAIAQILTNPKLAQQLREAGLQRAKDFSAQTVAQEYKALLTQI